MWGILIILTEQFQKYYKTHTLPYTQAHKHIHILYACACISIHDIIYIFEEIRKPSNTRDFRKLKILLLQIFLWEEVNCRSVYNRDSIDNIYFFFSCPNVMCVGSEIIQDRSKPYPECCRRCRDPKSIYAPYGSYQ